MRTKPPPSATRRLSTLMLMVTLALSLEGTDLTRQFQARRILQAAAIQSFEAFHDFRFADRVEETGITFSHRVVDDPGRHYKAVHYDHGNGVAAADVDGDGLLDLYFTTQLGTNRLYPALGNGRFEDITSKGDVGLGERVSVGASFGDIDNDGDPDLFVTTVKMGNVLFENLGGGKFRDISKSAGTGYVGHSSGAVFFDYDNDGLPDLFVTNVGVYTTDKKGAGGYLAQSAMPAYFGIDDAAKVDRIEIRWPGKHTQVLNDAIPANRLVTITEPALHSAP